MLVQKICTLKDILTVESVEYKFSFNLGHGMSNKCYRKKILLDGIDCSYASAINFTN